MDEKRLATIGKITSGPEPARQLAEAPVARAERGEAVRIDSIQRLSASLSKTPEELGLLKVDTRLLESDTTLPQQLPLKLEDIRSHSLPFAKELPEELQSRRKQIRLEHAQRSPCFLEWRDIRG
jgi:hypothetical protein